MERRRICELDVTRLTTRYKCEYDDDDGCKIKTRTRKKVCAINWLGLSSCSSECRQKEAKKIPLNLTTIKSKRTKKNAKKEELNNCVRF